MKEGVLRTEANSEMIPAMILAGGLGTRLRPVLPDVPKALAPVNGQPFLAYQLETLRTFGFKRVILCVSHLAEKVIDAATRMAPAEISVEYSRESLPMGTGGALGIASMRVERGPVLVLNGDTYVECDFGRLVQHHLDRKWGCTIAIRSVADTSNYGFVRSSDGGVVTEFIEKTSVGGGYVNAGVYVIEARLLHEIQVHTPSSLERDVLPGWVRRGLVGAVVIEGYFCDIGTPDSYAQFVRDVKAKRVDIGRI